MPRASEEAFWLDPKWLVAGVALAAEAMMLTYDVRLGVAAGTFFGVALAVWLYIAVRFGSLSGTPSVRTALVERSRQQEVNRRAAGESGAQQGPDPAERP